MLQKRTQGEPKNPVTPQMYPRIYLVMFNILGEFVVMAGIPSLINESHISVLLEVVPPFTGER